MPRNCCADCRFSDRSGYCSLKGRVTPGSSCCPDFEEN